MGKKEEEEEEVKMGMRQMWCCLDDDDFLPVLLSGSIQKRGLSEIDPSQQCPRLASPGTKVERIPLQGRK